jgi:hypothetical protein
MVRNIHLKRVVKSASGKARVESHGKMERVYLDINRRDQRPLIK